MNLWRVVFSISFFVACLSTGWSLRKRGWMTQARAEALIHLGRFDAARVDLQQVRLLDRFPVHLAYLAGVEAVTGNLPEARRLMDHAKTLAPDFTAAGFRKFYNSISTDNGGPNFEKMFDALEAAIP